MSKGPPGLEPLKRPYDYYLLKHCFHSVWMCSHAIYVQYIHCVVYVGTYVRTYVCTYTHTYILYVMSPAIEYQTFRHPLLPSSVIMAYRLGAAETSGICKNPTYVCMIGDFAKVPRIPMNGSVYV